MTLRSVGGVFYPDYSQYGAITSGTVTYQSFLLDASAEKVAFVFRAPKAGTLARVGFRTATVTTADTLKVSFQDVDATNGDPDGVVDQFRTVASAGVTSNTWIRTGLITSDGTDNGTLRSVTRGQVITVVIEFNAFVAGVVNIAANRVFGLTANQPMVGLNYVDHFTASWAKSTVGIGVIAIEYDDGSFAYLPNALPADTMSSNSVSSGTTPDEIALKVRLPFTAKVSGFYVAAIVAGDADVVLYDSDGTTPLATASIDKDQRVTGANISAGLFSSDVTLTANTFYWIALKPTTTTAETLYWFTVNATPGAAQLDQVSGGQDAYWTQRTDAGVWADTTTKRPLIGLILSALDDGVGGGLSRSRVVNAGGM